MPTSGFPSSGDESTLDDWTTAVISRRVGRIFRLGHGLSCDVTITSHTGDFTSVEAVAWSMAHCGAESVSTGVRRHFSSIDAINDDDAELLGCWDWGLESIRFSGRLKERQPSPRSAANNTIKNNSLTLHMAGGIAKVKTMVSASKLSLSHTELVVSFVTSLGYSIRYRSVN